jgi:hypothetical protein
VERTRTIVVVEEEALGIVKAQTVSGSGRSVSRRFMNE